MSKITIACLVIVTVFVVGCTQQTEPAAQHPPEPIKKEVSQKPRKPMNYINTHYAAQTGRLEALERASVESLSWQNEGGGQPIHVAVAFDQAEAVKLLIKRGVDVNARSADGLTPLHIAAATGSVQSFKVLIEHKADLTLQSTIGDSAIHIAVQESQLWVVESLLAAGAEVDQRKSDGTEATALMMAAYTGNAAIARALLRGGADRSLRTVRGSTALEIAEEMGHYEVVQVLQGL